jgi:acyl-CoA reductase-like NAD-dependent aldehyde dehydrogenase
VSAKQRERVLGYIEKGKAEGARVIAGGGRPEQFDKGWFVQPTLFADVSNDMTIAREEIFGPVLAIIGYRDEADAVTMANDTPYGLAGAAAESWERQPQRCSQRSRSALRRL